MAKNRNTRSDRRSTNVTPSRHNYPSPTYRLHVRPSPSVPDYTRDLIGAIQKPWRPETPPIADNRFWKPARSRDLVFSYSGTPAGRTRLQDAPRARSFDPFRAASSTPGTAKQARQRAQVNRWGPHIDRQTRARLVFELKKLPLCDQRKERREVLHARGIAGARVRRPKFKPTSHIGCR